MKKWQIVLNNFAFPLPDPKTEADKYWSWPLKNLSRHQLKHIIEMVVEEAKTSREFGLFIRSEDFEKEVAFWIKYLDDINPKELKQSDFVKLWNATSLAQGEAFEDISEYYFNLISKSKPKICSSNNAFNCHLESVRSKILHRIRDNDF